MPHEACYPLASSEAAADTFRFWLPTSVMSRWTACWRHFLTRLLQAVTSGRAWNSTRSLSAVWSGMRFAKLRCNTQAWFFWEKCHPNRTEYGAILINVAGVNYFFR